MGQNLQHHGDFDYKVMSCSWTLRFRCVWCTYLSYLDLMLDWCLISWPTVSQFEPVYFLSRNNLFSGLDILWEQVGCWRCSWVSLTEGRGGAMGFATLPLNKALECLGTSILKIRNKNSPPGSIISHHVSCVSWPPLPGKKANKNLGTHWEPHSNATHGRWWRFMEVWIKKNDMKRFDPSRRVPRCSWLSRFFIPKKTNQNVNDCVYVSLRKWWWWFHTIFMLFFFLGGGKAGSVVNVVFCMFLWMETPMQQKIYEQIGNDFFSTQHGSTLRTCWLALMWLLKVWIFQPFSMCLGCDDVTMWDFIA